MAWISVHEQVMGGKLHRFAKRAGCSKKEALGILVGMWLWGINNADEVGRLDEMDKSDVADAISSGLSEGLVPSKIVDAMLEVCETCPWMPRNLSPPSSAWATRCP